MPGGCRIRPGQDKAPVRVVGMRRPYLLTIDHPIVAIATCACAQVGEIRAGSWLGIALAPVFLSRKDLRKEAALLLWGAKPQQRVAEHLQRVSVIRRAVRHASAGELLDQRDLMHSRQTAAAVLNRPRDSEQAPTVKSRAPSFDEGGGFSGILNGADSGETRRQLLIEDGNDLRSEGLDIVVQLQVHSAMIQLIDVGR